MKQIRARRILVIDDDPKMCESLSQVLGREGYEVQQAYRGEEGLERIRERNFDLVLTDLSMPGMDGLGLLKSVKTIAPDTGVIIITGYGTIDSAVRAMKHGATDYITKPIRAPQLRLVVSKALATHDLMVENKYLRSRLQEKYSPSRVVGQSAAMRKILGMVEQVAPSKATVLLTGETGTGKEMIAETIHYLSPRANKPFVKVNCAALPETLLESELFGHEKGAFTGAHREREGRFEYADRGTLFLDEIGEMSPSAQLRLLRVLQEGEFERVGSTRPIRVDVRVIAATNSDLASRVRQRAFREDLYYRIKVIHIELPPLRQRREDIPILVQHFIEKYNKVNQRAVQGIGQQVLDRMLAYDWPGNVRELENVIERAVIMTEGRMIRMVDLPEEIRGRDPKEEQITLPLGLTLQDAERLIIQKTLDRLGGDKQTASRILGISGRTLYRKLKEYEIELPEKG